LFFEQGFSDCGFAALLAERLCLSVRAFRESAATPPRQSLKQLTGSTESQRLSARGAAKPRIHSLLVVAVLRCVICGYLSFKICVICVICGQKFQTPENRMNFRQFGRLDWKVSEIGYGMWGMGSWSNSDDNESLGSLQAAVELGCNFFDTAYAYGEGHSESLLGQVVRSNQTERLYTATKVPPKNLKWPAAPDSTLMESYPPDHVEEFVHRSLENAGLQQFDLVQLHTWNDDWMRDDRWFYKLDDLRSQKLINGKRYQHQSLGTVERDTRSSQWSD
jgi:hypothetical protein